MLMCFPADIRPFCHFHLTDHKLFCSSEICPISVFRSIVLCQLSGQRGAFPLGRPSRHYISIPTRCTIGTWYVVSFIYLQLYEYV